MKNKLKFLLFIPLLLSACDFSHQSSESDYSSESSSGSITDTTTETSETEIITTETETEPGSETESETDTGTSTTEEKKAAWTIMIYMCGSDLESGEDDNGRVYGLASLDIAEILSVTGQPDDINIIIETGGAVKWSSNYKISSTKLGRYHVRDRKLVKDDELTYASMGAESTFESFLNWGFSEYPAEKNGVILWNHGGAMDGCCYDEKKNNDSLLNSETKTAFTNALKANNIKDKLEFVGYDCCLMQVQDIAEFNSNFFNYMVAAQESEAGEGWAYNLWLDDLYQKKSTETILKAIADGFIDSYEETYGYYYDNDQTLSVLDLSKMAEYKTAFETLMGKLISPFKSRSSNIYNMVIKCKTFGNEYGFEQSEYQQYVNNYGYDSSWFVKESDGTYTLLGSLSFGTIDVKDFLTKLKAISGFTSYATEIDTVISKLNDLVIYNAIGDEAGNSNGLSCIAYLYSGFFNDSYKTSQTNFTNWRNAIGQIAL